MDRPHPQYTESGASRDAIDDALYRYFEFMLGWYFEPASLLRLKRMQRVASRIFRHAPVHVVQSDDAALLVARVLVGLDRWVRQASEMQYTDGGTQQESVMVHRDTCLAVPGGCSDEDSLRESVLRFRQHPPSAGRIRIATVSILRHWFRQTNPRQHSDWIVDSELVRGADIFLQIEPPDEQACIHGLLSSTSLVLDFPQLETVILQSVSEWFAGEAYRSLVERGWFLKLYLEKGIQFPQHGRTIREINRHYPAASGELMAIQQMSLAAGCDLTDLRMRAFRLLKYTAFDVNRALMAAPVAAAI